MEAGEVTEGSGTAGAGPSRRTLLGLAAVGALAGCTTSWPSPSASSAAAPSSTGRISPTSTSPRATATTATPTIALPLALVVHPTRAAGMRTTRAVLTSAVAGRPVTWEQLGSAGGSVAPMRGTGAGGSTPDSAVVAAVHADRGRLGVVRADALGPGVAALTVDGVHPVGAPDRYPVSIADPATAAIRPDRVTTTLWVGDVMLGRRVGTAISAAGDVSLPFHDAAGRLRAAALTVGNLECTMSRNGKPTQGGDSFGADPATLAGLRDAGFVQLDRRDSSGDRDVRRCPEPRHASTHRPARRVRTHANHQCCQSDALGRGRCGGLPALGHPVHP